MPLTPETLTRHELNGLPVRVVDAANSTLVGIEGRVVAETQGTLSVASADRVWQVPKQGSKFEFALTDESAGGSESHSERRRAKCDGIEKTSGTTSERESETAGVRSGQSGSSGDTLSPDSGECPRDCEGVAYVTVDGARLLSRPELRTEKAGESTWQ
jgi:ribonuclease P protein subunit POP4